MTRGPEHAALLEQAVLAGVHHRPRLPAQGQPPARAPGQDALTELARLKGVIVEPAPAIDLGRYAAFEVAC